MLTQEGVDRAATRVALMPFFPSSQDNSKAVLIEQLISICGSDEQALWLAMRMTQVFKRWPGEGEMRALYCKRFKPADGYEAVSNEFPEGFPSEAELGPLPIKGLPEPPKPQGIAAPRERLIAGNQRMIEAPVSGDEPMESLVSDLAVALEMPAPKKPRTADEIAAELYKLHPIPEPKKKGSFEEQLKAIEAKAVGE